MTAIRFAGLSLAATTGIAGLVADNHPEWLDWPSINLHAAFAAALLSMVLVSLRTGSADEAPLALARERCRALSRQVYLLLYGMVAACQIMHMVSARPLSPPPDVLRDYFVYGMLALFAIRVLTVLSVRRPPARQMSPRLARADDGAARR